MVSVKVRWFFLQIILISIISGSQFHLPTQKQNKATQFGNSCIHIGKTGVKVYFNSSGCSHESSIQHLIKGIGAV